MKFKNAGFFARFRVRVKFPWKLSPTFHHCHLRSYGCSFNVEIVLCIGKSLHALRHLVVWRAINLAEDAPSNETPRRTRVRMRPSPVRIRRKLFRGVDWRMTKSRKPPANRCSGNFPRTLNPFDRYINITRSGAPRYSNVVSCRDEIKGTTSDTDTSLLLFVAPTQRWKQKFILKFYWMETSWTLIHWFE